MLPLLNGFSYKLPFSMRKDHVMHLSYAEMPGPCTVRIGHPGKGGSGYMVHTVIVVQR